VGKRGPGARVAQPIEQTGLRPWEAPGLTRADRVIRFIEALTLTNVSHAGKPFQLRPWQKKIIRSIYATRKDGRRQVRTAVISLPRGQGKTQLAAALMLAHLVGPEAQPRAELYSCASSRDQAARVWREALAMVDMDEDLKSRVTPRAHEKRLTDEVTGSVYAALSADSRKGHSLAPSLVIYDELGQALNRELFDAMSTGLGKDPESLMIVISTQAPSDDHVMSQLVDHGLAVNAGDVEDPGFYACIFAAPMDADPWDPATWDACNPALGDFLDREDFERQAKQAQRSPSFESAFRLLRLNQRVAESATFISRDAWTACAADAEPKGPCWAALDTASTTDLAALVAYWPETGAVRAWFWTPADTVLDREHADRAPYSTWARQGLLLTTPGRTIDLRAPLLQIGELTGAHEVRGVAHDRWRVAELRRLADELGVAAPFFDFGQGFKDMAPAVDACERAILEQSLRHGGHPVLTWNVGNAIVVTDPAGNRKVDKSRSTGRIDGLVALIMAIGLHAREPAPREYDFSGGMFILRTG
jgi:phage terminase large subunit-like protein